MGYTTDFYGEVNVTPPLNEAERTYLRKFAETRRMDRERGPYFVDGTGDFGQGHDPDIRNFNGPPAGQPSLWCQWVPNEDGTAIEWDGQEKFYESEAWMAYVIDHFLKPGAEASKVGDPQFAGFTFDHVCNGTIEAQGEQHDDKWRLVVEDNIVRVQSAKIVWED
jgi:hypothetical protein